MNFIGEVNLNRKNRYRNFEGTISCKRSQFWYYLETLACSLLVTHFIMIWYFNVIVKMITFSIQIPLKEQKGWW